MPSGSTDAWWRRVRADELRRTALVTVEIVIIGAGATGVEPQEIRHCTGAHVTGRICGPNRIRLR
jgi:NADH dehydrogenase FAD-containing subunit